MSAFPQQLAWKTRITSNDATAQEPVGAVRYEYDTTNGVRGFKYVQAASDTTVANGTVLMYSDTIQNTATLDISNSDANINQPVGVGTGTITAEYYGWVQCYGYHSAVLTNGDDDIADGDSIIVDASNDGVCNSTASGTAPVSTPLGVAVAADSDTGDTVATFLGC